MIAIAGLTVKYPAIKSLAKLNAKADILITVCHTEDMLSTQVTYHVDCLITLPSNNTTLPLAFQTLSHLPYA